MEGIEEMNSESHIKTLSLIAAIYCNLINSKLINFNQQQNELQIGKINKKNKYLEENKNEK